MVRSSFHVHNVAIVILVLLVISSNAESTTRCPCNSELWKERSDVWSCADKNKFYTCITDDQGRLMETCMFQYTIRKSQHGCPFIGGVVENYGPQLSGTLSPCNVTNCPPSNHQGYTLSELYKFPACFLDESERRNMDKQRYQEKLDNVCVYSIKMERLTSLAVSLRPSISYLLVLFVSVCIS